jgi:transposase
VLALAAIDEGAARPQAAAIGGVTLQVIRDWVVRFNAHGPDGLIDRKAPGRPSRLDEAQGAALAAMVESGPVPAVHGGVRWRLIDLCQWLWDEFRVSVSWQTLGRELRAMQCRKLSARPRHHAQAEGAIETFKKASPPAWTRSRARRASRPATSRSGSAIRPASARRTRPPGAGRGLPEVPSGAAGWNGKPRASAAPGP